MSAGLWVGEKQIALMTHKGCDSLRGRLTGTDGITRQPPSERRLITFRAAKG